MTAPIADVTATNAAPDLMAALRDSLTRAREARERQAQKCGCMPERECDRHWLDEDDRMRRLTDV